MNLPTHCSPVPRRHRLVTAAVSALLVSVGVLPSRGATPQDELQAAVTAGSDSTVEAAAPKAFLAALSAVLAGQSHAQVPAYAAAAAGLRPDLAGPITDAAISALHLPGQLPEPALVAAVVKAVLTAAPDASTVIAARALADAPEAREAIAQAVSAAQSVTVRKAVAVSAVAGSTASDAGLPFSQVRLSDLPAPAALLASAKTPTAVVAPVSATSVTPAATASGALNPVNVSTPRRRNPPVSGF